MPIGPLSGFETSRQSRLVWTAALSVLLLAALWGAVREQTFDRLLSPLDAQAERYLEETLTKTALTYAAARGVHAVVSVLQGMELHPPFVTVAIGEALDPVRDLIERFSNLMLLASASLGAQRLLMEIGQMAGLGVVAAAGIALMIAALWVERYRETLFLWGQRLVIAGVAIRLMIPLMAFGAAQMGDALLAARYADSIDRLELQKGAMEVELVTPEPASGWVDRAKGWLGGEEFTGKLEALKRQGEELVRSLMTLFTLFLFEALLFPLLSLWLLSKLFWALAPKPQT